MTPKTDRAVAVSVLIDVLDAGAFANIALRKAFTANALEPRARAFVTDIVNETLRNLIQIDSIIGNFSKTPIQDMKPFIRSVLRVSVCQIRFMEKIPPRAAINEAVNLTKAQGFENLGGFVNAILRNIDRETPREMKNIALKYSYPQWLADKLTIWLGQDGAYEFCESSHQIPPVIVLTNTHKTTQAKLVQRLLDSGVETTPLDGANHPFLMLHKPGDITALSAFRDGWFFVIDPGALYAVDAVVPQPGQTIMDVCAAPGGKSFAMACAMQNTGKILSYDIHPHRVDLISQTRKRLGLGIIETYHKDATVFDPALAGLADAVLLDAPCSGFGTIRKHPEIKYSRTMQDVISLAKMQRTMLGVVSKYVKPGGKLVYCTCTVTKDENEDTIKFFLKTHPHYRLDDSIQLLPSSTSDAFYIATLIHCV